MIEIRLPEDDIEEHRISNKTLESAMSLLKLYTFIIHMFQTIFKLSDTAMSVFVFFATFLQTMSQTLQVIKIISFQSSHAMYTVLEYKLQKLLQMMIENHL